jgi:serine/alanine racemase
LILGYTEPRRAAELVHYRLTQTVVDGEHAQRLKAAGQPIAVHLKVDTGMHRLGFSDQHAAEIARLLEYEPLDVQGIYTHLSVADSLDGEDLAFTKEQIQRFHHLLEELVSRGLRPPKTHLQSSYGLFNHHPLRCDYARIGIALYGALSSPQAALKRSIDLRPVLALKARVALVRTISAGESVGYGRQFVAQRETRMAVLAIGYADGLPRELASGGGSVLLRGCRAPLIGRICMDQLMVDVTELPDIKQGDIATLIGRDGREEISAEQVARAAGTITNELFSRLGDRLERVYLEADSGTLSGMTAVT